jgi:hypothetical protein
MANKVTYTKHPCVYIASNGDPALVIFADFYREVSGTRVQADIVIESADAPHA